MDYKKIVLINPPINMEVAMGRIKNLRKSMVQMPLGIAYLAAYLKSNGISSVDIIDAYAEDLSIEQTVNLCIEKNADIVGISCVTAVYPTVCEIAKKLKKIKPTSIVVVGGEHPTVLPEETLKNSAIDIAVRGEGEVTLLEVVKYLERGNLRLDSIDGVSYKDNGRVVHNRNRNLIEDLDTLPFPAYELLPMHLYKAPPHWSVTAPSFQMIASRGCPYSCTFCSLGVMGKIRRVRSPKNIISEIKYLIDKYNAKQIMFWDPTFPVSRKEGMEFCKEIISAGLNKKIVWTTECRVNIVDEELLDKMHEAGCRIICYGIESGVQELLDNVKKGFTLDQVRKAVELTKKADIRIYANYILGLPGETSEMSLRTLEFSKELDTEYVQFNLMVPYPGTIIFEEALRDGILDPTDWSRFIQASPFMQHDPIYVPVGMKKEELKAIAKRSYREYYLRPRIFLKHIKLIKSFRDIKRYAMVAVALIKGTL